MEIDISNHKLMYHPERVSEWRKNGDCYPIYIEIGLTNSCNHKCIFCALDFLNTKGVFIDREVMLKAIKEMGEKGVKSIMFAGEGESTLHPDIGLFVKTAKDSGIDVSITTNGAAFNNEKIKQCLPYLSWIRFSIDSGSKENYSLIHGTSPDDFDKLIENLKECVRIKRENNLKVIIGAQFLMIPQSMNEAIKLTKILKDIGADNLQIKPYSKHPDSINDLIMNSQEYNKIEEQLKEFNSDSFKIFFRKETIERIQGGINYPECYGIPFFALIDALGNVVPCNLFYGNEEFTYGNLHEKSFSEIWASEKRKEILKKLKERGCESCRKGCRLDVINRYLYRLKNPFEHDNFI
ncbi:MAG: radical SAM protein [Nanoarchaeota archaeon]